MKRAFSLILALAMLTSLFTTVSFAADPTKATSAELSGVSYTNATNENTKAVLSADKGTLTIYYIGSLSIKADATEFTFTLPSGTVSNKSYENNQLKFTSDDSNWFYIDVVLKPIIVTVATKNGDAAKWTANGNTLYYLNKIATTEPTIADFDKIEAKTGSTALFVDGHSLTGDLTINISESEGGTLLFEDYDTNYDVVIDTIRLNQISTYAPNATGVTFKNDTTALVNQLPIGTPVGALKVDGVLPAGFSYASDLIKTENTAVAGVNEVKLTDDHYHFILPVNVTKCSADFAVDIPNGSTKSYAAAGLKSTVINEIKNDYNLATAPTGLAELTLTVPAAASGKAAGVAFYEDSAAKSAGDEIDLINKAMTVTTTKGELGLCEASYTAKVAADGPAYSGKITFRVNAIPAAAINITAPFSREGFYTTLGGMSKYRVAPAAGVASSSTNATAMPVNGFSVAAPTATTPTATTNYLGYAADNTAYAVTLTVTHNPYDLLSYVQDGGMPFNSAYFNNFAKNVVEARTGNTVYSGDVSNVKFTTNYNASNNYTTGYVLYSGATPIANTSAGLTSTQLNAVTIDVLRAATYYDIPFSCNYSYYYYTNTTTGTISNTVSATISGIVRVSATAAGDLTYEVSYGDSVTMKASDFQWLYSKLTNSTRTLDYITVDQLPTYGTLYDIPNRTLLQYKTTAGEAYYVAATGNRNALNTLTYWAANAYSAEYSDYFVVTMHGVGGAAVSTVVEIVINGDIPFLDVAKNSTFYEYIRYCYNNDIMGGKSATKFDAKSNISRIQLVTTLYRMAGSPTTYNNRTLPFADTKNLSAEFTNALKWAYAKGIASGSGNNFNPNTAVTRQAMVTILYRYARTAGYDTSVWSEYHLANYTDGGKVSASMRDAMNWAVDYELISGNGSNLLPGGSTTRGAAAKILANFHSTYVG